MVSEISASASTQFFETSNTSHAMYSSLRWRITSATRNRSEARSSTVVRLQWVKALRAAFTAGSKCSFPALCWGPTPFGGFGGTNLVGGLDALAADDQVVFAAELSAHFFDGGTHFADVIFFGEIDKGLVCECTLMKADLQTRRGFHGCHLGDPFGRYCY